jgi:hypothetical protein
MKNRKMMKYNPEKSNTKGCDQGKNRRHKKYNWKNEGEN